MLVLSQRLSTLYEKNSPNLCDFVIKPKTVTINLSSATINLLPTDVNGQPVVPQFVVNSVENYVAMADTPNEGLYYYFKTAQTPGGHTFYSTNPDTGTGSAELQIFNN